jgi:hypothetical protein
MSLKINSSNELQRTPIATIATVVGVVIATLSLVLAWVQYRVGPPLTVPSTTGAQLANMLLGNVFLVVAYFLAITVAAALLIRTIARKHDIAAFFTSIPLVALTNFSAILVIYLAPPRALNAQLFASAHDLVFYASAVIVIAFCGKAILIDIASNGNRKTSESKTETAGGGSDSFGILFGALIVLAVWSWLVFAGQTRLTRTLLPEVTHHIEVKPEEVKALKSGA